MLDETVHAAILQLRSQLTGVIGQMKDMARRRTEHDDVVALSRLGIQAAQLQAGIQALTQLRGDIVETGRDALRLSEEAPTEVSVEEEEQGDSDVITEDIMEARRVKPSPVWGEED